MSELEQALVRLGHELELPAAPDVTAVVRARLRGRPGRRLRLVLAAVAVLLAALAAAFAVPQSRGALLRFLHIPGAEVSLVDRVPHLPPSGFPGRQIRPEQAAGYLGARPLYLDGVPPDILLAERDVLQLYYASPGIRVTEVRTGGAIFLKKVAGTTGARYVQVGGDFGIWIGGPHLLELPHAGRAGTVGKTLLWQHGAVTLRLEGATDLSAARSLALAFR